MSSVSKKERKTKVTSLSYAKKELAVTHTKELRQPTNRRRIERDYELSILATNGSPLISRKVTKCLFNEYKHGFSDFVERSENLENRKDEFLKNDTLTLRCRLWESRMSQKIHSFCKTRPNIDRTHFLWTLDRFSSLTLQDEKVASLRTADEGSPLLEMKLFFVELEEEEKIQIEITNPHSVECCKCRFSVLDINGISIESFQDELVFCSEDAIDKRQVPPFLSKRKLMERKNQCLPNDTLSLKCEFSYYSEMETYISENTFCNLDDFNSTEPQLSSASAIDISQKSTANPLGDDLKIFNALNQCILPNKPGVLHRKPRTD
ncbi:speckle-type POZ protein B [Caerostris darwini]|uniref:Speckle-type POZ protein B n=1 Tax=Caerostris darwini TaxID=1538125 RepID=A0AAV4WF76_9ARAC|nr:speckle-type POZ protein B [Caerostris darwini]